MPPSCHALIPAAGTGTRAGAPLAKQYMPLNGEPMLAHTIRPFLAVARVTTVRVVVSPGDPWPASAHAQKLLAAAGGRLRFDAVGGATRAQSVANGLAALAADAALDDWVLVHDAARPCITPTGIEAMIEALVDDPVGGLLALPLADTLKRADAGGRVVATIPRADLWRAQTPQMFRLGVLRRAYASAPDMTDEAGAIEALGLSPRLVHGNGDNIKVTFPDDFDIAERWLAARSR